MSIGWIGGWMDGWMVHRLLGRGKRTRQCKLSVELVYSFERSDLVEICGKEERWGEVWERMVGTWREACT